jgi:hypothetical protein
VHLNGKILKIIIKLSGSLTIKTLKKVNTPPRIRPQAQRMFIRMKKNDMKNMKTFIQIPKLLFYPICQNISMSYLINTSEN